MVALKRRRTPRERKVRVAVSLQPDTVKWIKSRVGPTKPFWSISHAVEQAISNLRDKKGH